MLISHSGFIISHIYYDFNDKTNIRNETSIHLVECSLMLLCTTGSLNFIAFIFDPTIFLAFKKIYLKHFVKNDDLDGHDLSNTTYMSNSRTNRWSFSDEVESILSMLIRSL
ncbi:hypothetical protein K502DRAFT_181904 [Neoconidiobolus thromboides FSU 785]|nr:hypothetical protein K502DRAFT_181904 [Neoconidiobolus thromboides FSU 785]